MALRDHYLAKGAIERKDTRAKPPVDVDSILSVVAARLPRMGG